MRKVLFTLPVAALALSAAPASAKTYVCVKWDNGVCVSMHRVKGEQPAPTPPTIRKFGRRHPRP